MATKKSIAEQALRVIQGEIILFVEQERDALIKQMILGYSGMGEHEITGDFLSSFTLDSTNNQIILTYSPINLPSNTGIFSVVNGSEFYLKRPSSNMYSNALSKSSRNFPIPADMESQIIKSVVQLYGLMRQANEDNINDRQDNKQ